MRISSKPMAVVFSAATDRFSRILRHAKAVAVILCIAQIHSPIEARGQAPAASYNMNLAWDVHPDPAVTGYTVYYGTASRAYTANIAVGNLTQTTIPGLAEGVTYFFTLTAINTSGLESAFSNEVSFLPGNHATSLSTTATGEMALTVRGLIGQQYDIEASQDLKIWNVISTVTMADGGSLEFSDPDKALYPTRFYRTRQSP